MQKRKSIRIALLVAGIIWGTFILVKMIFIFCNPLQRLMVDLLMKHPVPFVLPINLKLVYLIRLLLFQIPICVLAFYNYRKPDFKKRRGFATMLILACLSLVSTVSGWLCNFRIRWQFDSCVIALADLVNNVPDTVFGWPLSAASIILWCCAAIEVYNGHDEEKRMVTLVPGP